jgi:uncharacterized membrane protein
MSKERLTTFIDAVIAIIITILVLELKKPTEISLTGFWALKQNFFAYTLSFFWLGTMWVNLHNEWYHLKKVDRKTIWATLVMLFFSSLFPYATSIVAEHFHNQTAQVFYGIVVLLITFANSVMYYFLWQANSHDALANTQYQKRNHWIRYDIVIKLVGLAVALFVYPAAMSYSVLITLVFLALPRQFAQKH